MFHIKFFLAVCLILVGATQMGTASTTSEDLKKLNTEIVVSIEGMPEPEQALKLKTADNIHDERWPNLNTKPVPVKYGSRLKLKIEAIGQNGKREDITKSKYIRIHTTFFRTHLCGDVTICAGPEKGVINKSESRIYGNASITVEYLTPEGKIGFNGFVIDVQPHPNAPPVAQTPPSSQLIAKNSGSKLTKQEALLPDAWKKLLALPGIDVKNNSSDLLQLIVFFDPNCPACADLWKSLYGKESRYNQTVTRWVPVVHMHESSMGKASYLLERRSRQALAQNFDVYNEKTQQGNAPSANASSQMRRTIERNTKYWKKLFGATPLIVYRAADGKTYLQRGLPPQEQLEILLKQVSPRKLELYGK